ncbi:hypothetical protein LCGC14_1900390 [marine sediment metagenome]|uniref:Uncharacterized protein n=1 Tax=marine sediment metagenome TaxID=412755 RepID=A0A0F9IAP8_9ZZZZ
MAIEFIALLGLEINMVDKINEPQDDLRPGDDIKGEISEELQKLYTVWKRLGQSAGALENDIQWGNTSPDAFSKVQELRAKASLIKAILWIAIQDELHLWDSKDPLALRKGFKIVGSKGPEIPPIFKFLGGFE